MKTLRRVKCDNCPDGVVLMVSKEKSKTTDYTVKDCDKCGKSFTFPQASKLEDAI